MTHFSLKSAVVTASLLTLSAGISVFAEPVTADCKNPLFAANACNECYTDIHQPTKNASGWSIEIPAVKIPWTHSGIELQEVILESNQKLPEMIASTDVQVTPTAPEAIWEFNSDIVWYPVGSDREFFIDKGDKVGIYSLKSGVKLTISGKGAKDTVLFKTPLFYEEYEKDLGQSSDGKSRNICVLNSFNTGAVAPIVTPPVIPTPTPEKEVVVPKDTIAPLNAAGPEEEEEVPEITPEQTETKAGPGMWIFLLLAFAFSSAWTAWNKQKI